MINWELDYNGARDDALKDVKGWLAAYENSRKLDDLRMAALWLGLAISHAEKANEREGIR